jgi:hypothetical protein
LQALAVFQCADKIPRIQQAAMGPRVEPGIAAAHGFDAECTLGKKLLQQIGDLGLICLINARLAMQIRSAETVHA